MTSLPVVSLTNNPEPSVLQRYSAAAQAVEPALCCPIEYDRRLLQVLPAEILERDYGCGDPSQFVRPGDTVLDLGSGGGKICYIAAQIVGTAGRVIGVDYNPDMLALARKYLPEMADKLGYANVEFRAGMIQDLKLDLDRLADRLQQSPVQSAADWVALRQLEQQLRDESPLIPDNSVDCVVSNCVLNLVRPEDRRQLLSEVYRVLKDGGRAAISDIVSDETVPEALQNDPTLWSGCISGAFREDEFLRAFADAGFHGIQIAKRDAAPWQVVEGIEFRSMTVVAWKGTAGPAKERNQAVVYRGPFKSVIDDDGHTFERGQRIAVSDKTFQLLKREPYSGDFLALEPAEMVPLEQAELFDPNRPVTRDPREMKTVGGAPTTNSAQDCCSGQTCC